MAFFQKQAGHKRTCVHSGWGPGGAQCILPRQQVQLQGRLKKHHTILNVGAGITPFSLFKASRLSISMCGDGTDPSLWESDWWTTERRGNADLCLLGCINRGSSIQMNLVTKQKLTHRHRKQTYGYQRGLEGG